MRFIELLVGILAASLVMAATVLSFSAGRKGSERIVDTSHDYGVVMDLDGKLRTAIRSLEIPYWRNPENYLTEMGFDLSASVPFPEGAEILDTTLLRDGSGCFVGMDVFWIFDGKEYETKEMFR